MSKEKNTGNMQRRVVIDESSHGFKGLPVVGDIDELPLDETQRLNVLRSQLHDAAFSYLRIGARGRDPWDVGKNEERFRATVAAHLAGEDDEMGLDFRKGSQNMPEFASRLNLPAEGLGKAKIKLLFGTEQAYEKYVETLTLVDGVQQREAVAEKFRHQLFERFPKLESALSDEIFDAEMEELTLKREVSRLHLGNTRAERIAVDSMDEKVAMLAAGSMQPVLCSLIQAALKKRTARKGATAMELMSQSVDKRLARSTGAQDRQRDLTEQGPGALEDRAKALLSLCENLREENQERFKSGGHAPVLQQRLDALLEVNSGLREITRGGTEVYPAVGLLQSAARGLNLREEEERKLQAEDEACASSIKAGCLQKIFRVIYINAIALPNLARAMPVRREFISTIRASEVLKASAKRVLWRWMYAKLANGIELDALMQLLAADREEAVQEEVERERAEEHLRRSILAREEERLAAAAVAAAMPAARAAQGIQDMWDSVKAQMDRSVDEFIQDEAAAGGGDEELKEESVRGELSSEEVAARVVALREGRAKKKIAALEQREEELRQQMLLAKAAANQEQKQLKAHADKVALWAQQYMSDEYLQQLGSVLSDTAVGELEVTRLDLNAAERGASRQVLRISRYGVRSRRGDVHQVGDKCAAATTAWQELVSILALPDAIKGEVQRATYRFQNAQKAAAKAIEIADDEASKKGLWDEVTAGHSAFAYMDILFEMRGRGIQRPLNHVETALLRMQGGNNMTKQVDLTKQLIAACPEQELSAQLAVRCLSEAKWNYKTAAFQVQNSNQPSSEYS